MAKKKLSSPAQKTYLNYLKGYGVNDYGLTPLQASGMSLNELEKKGIKLNKTGQKYLQDTWEEQIKYYENNPQARKEYFNKVNANPYTFNRSMTKDMFETDYERNTYREKQGQLKRSDRQKNKEQNESIKYYLDKYGPDYFTSENVHKVGLKNGGDMKTKKLPQVQYNKPVYNLRVTEDELYSLGGWLKENSGSLLSTAAGVGMSLIPGLQGVGLPMAVSGAAGLLGSATADRNDEDLERRNAMAAYQTQMNMPKTVGTKNMTPNVMQFKKGGLMQIKGPKHEQGGVQLENGIEVEGGENIENNVVNSDSWMITQNIADTYGLPKKAVGKTAADYRLSVEKRYKGREGDPFAMKSKEIEGNNISQMSKEIAELMPRKNNKYREGGDILFDENGRPYKIDAFGRKSYSVGTLQDIGKFMKSDLGQGNWGWANKSGTVTPYINEFGQREYDYEFDENGKLNSNQPIKQTNGVPLEIEAGKPIVRYPDLNSFRNNSIDSIRNFGKGDIKSNGIGAKNGSSFNPVDTFMEGERNWVANMGNNLAQKPLYEQPINNSASVPRVSTLNAGTEPLAKMETKGIVGKTGSNIDLGNVGQTALGLAPMAIQAFMNARNKTEGYDKVKLPRLHAEEMNPQLIDPSYQVQQAQDAFATGNEQMSQVSKKDFLRRRIQSATEEGKTTSGIRGAAAATNTQLLNQAKEINLQNKIRTGMANIETQLQEENINAANKGAWQTARDYGLSNLGTMAGEYARDLRLEKSQDLFNDNTLTAMNASTSITGYEWQKDDTGHLKYTKVGNAQAPVLNPISAVERNTSHTFNTLNEYKGAPTLEDGYGNYNFPGFNKKITGRTYSNGRYR